MANEKRLIDANKVYKKLHEAGGCDAERNSWADGWDKAIDEVIRIVEAAPTVDAVEVVRCKDCKHLESHCNGKAGICPKRKGVARADDFCSYGERRKD